MARSGLRIQFTALRTNAAIKPDAATRQQLEVYTAMFMAKLLTTVSKYPAWEPDVYVRTQTLFKSWRLIPDTNRDAIRVVIQNNARDNLVGVIYDNAAGEMRTKFYTRRRGRLYARLVHGPGSQQIGYHAEHGWKNISAEIERLGGRGKFARGAQDIIDKSLVDFGA